VTFYGMITSPENASVKYVRSLHKKRVRYREKRYLIEGLRLVVHALQRGVWPVFAFYSEALAATRHGKQLVECLRARQDTRVWCVTPSVIKAVCDTDAPQGIAAVVPMQELPSGLPHQATLLLVLDNIRDPGNLGTTLRTAQATYVDAVVLSPGCADPYSPKVVRAAMGAHFDLTLFRCTTWPALENLVKGKRCVLADPEAQSSLWVFDWSLPVALFVGNEAHGASPEARRIARQSVRLPMAKGANSLNAAVAAAVLLFEVERQRKWRGQIPVKD